MTTSQKIYQHALLFKTETELKGFKSSLKQLESDQKECSVNERESLARNPLKPNIGGISGHGSNGSAENDVKYVGAGVFIQFSSMKKAKKAYTSQLDTSPTTKLKHQG